MAFLSDSQHCAENLYLTRHSLRNAFLWWLDFQRCCINVCTNYLATTCSRRINLVIITLYWAVCRQLSATLWWLTSFVLLFMSGITEHCHRSAHIYWAQDKLCPFSSKRSPTVFSRLLNYCVAHTNGYIFHLSQWWSLCFHHIPSEGSSVCTFITLGLHKEEFSIRSGCNKSSLTGEMVH